MINVDVSYFGFKHFLQSGFSRVKSWPAFLHPNVFLNVFGLMALAVLSSQTAMANAENSVKKSNFPNKQISIIVPSVKGDTSDLLARAIGQELHKAWQQPINIINLPDAAFKTGPEQLAQSAPDGYTLMMGHLSMLYAHLDQPRQPTKRADEAAAVPWLKLWEDFTPVAMVADVMAQMTVSWAEPPPSPLGLPTSKPSKRPVIPQEVPHWYGMVAPKNTPADVVQILNTSINHVLKTPAMQALAQGLADKSPKNRHLYLVPQEPSVLDVRIKYALELWQGE